MARWGPDARGRLLNAALDLFAEQGYDATTTAQVAERADLTKTTLFRLFADKREILFQGQQSLVDIAVTAIEAASPAATGMSLIRVALVALSDAHVPEQQEIGRRIARLVAASRELQERSAFKRATISTAIEDAVCARIGDHRRAGLLADLGVRAYYAGFAQWIDTRRNAVLSEVVLAELAELVAAARTATTEAHH